MNKLTIIGNLTRDVELRKTQSGKDVANFTVAVNRRAKAGEQAETDYFRVSVWNQMALTCQKYLAKGRKVCVVGSVSVTTYTGNNGNTRATLEVMAQDIEFLSPRQGDADDTSIPAQNDFTQVDNDDELPF